MPLDDAPPIDPHDAGLLVDATSAEGVAYSKLTENGRQVFLTWFAATFVAEHDNDDCYMFATEIIEAFERSSGGFEISLVAATEAGLFAAAGLAPVPGWGEETCFRVREKDALGIHHGTSGEPQRIEYVVDGIVPKGSVGMFVGAANELKTWAVLSIGKAVSKGEPWMGRGTKKGCVVHVDFEMGAAELERRMHVVGDDGTVGKASMPKLNLADERFWTELAKRRPALVSIDSLSRGNPDIDEKDSRAAAPLDRAKRFAEEHGTAFIFVHHSPKVTGKASLMEIIRGSGAIAAALDTAFFVERIETFESDDPHECRAVVTCKKMRQGGHEPAPFRIKLTDAGGVELHDERGRPASVDGMAPTDDDLVLAAVRAHPGEGSRRQLKEWTGLSAERATDARKRLLEAGHIENRGTEKAPELHAI